MTCGSEDHTVTAADTFFAHPVFHLFADDAAFGMPEDEAGAGDFLDGEQVELFAEDAVVAGLDFFEVLEVGVEIFLGEEGGSVESLELGVLLIAEPIGAGETGDLEGFDAAGGGDMGAAAEVYEVAVAVEGDFVAGFGEALDEVELHEVVVGAEVFQALFAGDELANEGLVAGDDFGHFLLDPGEVIGSEGSGAIEVVEEAAFGGGAVAEFGFRIELEDGGRHDVSGRVAEDVERVGGFVGEELEGDVVRERSGEVDEARLGGVGSGIHGGFGGRFLGGDGIVRDGRVGDILNESGCGDGRPDAGDEGSLGEARGDGVGDVQGSGSGGESADGAVGQSDLNFAHGVENRISRRGR